MIDLPAAVIIAVILAFPLWLFTVLFLRVFRQWELNETAKRIRRSTTFRYDPLGNPEYFVNPRTGNYFIPNPGNPAFPKQYLMNNGVSKEVREPEKPIMWNLSTGFRLSENPVVNEPTERDEPKPVFEGSPELEEGSTLELPEGKSIRTFAENVTLIKALYERGVGIEQAVREVTGLKSKGGTTFRRYVESVKGASEDVSTF